MSYLESPSMHKVVKTYVIARSIEGEPTEYIHDWGLGFATTININNAFIGTEADARKVMRYLKKHATSNNKFELVEVVATGWKLAEKEQEVAA